MSTTETTPRIGDPALDGDHEKNSHIVVPASAVTEAYINGTPVTALCGKVWVPNRAPERYPVCETCKEIFEEITGQGFPG